MPICSIIKIDCEGREKGGNVIDYLIAGLSTAVPVYATIKYSSYYHVRGRGKAREKYMVVERIPHRTKRGIEDIARLVIVKSSVKNAMGFMDVEVNCENNDRILVKRYAFIHTFIHVWFAPGRIILKEEQNWIEKVESNYFKSFYISCEKKYMLPVDLISASWMRKIRRRVEEFITTKCTFKYPKTYTGPRYKERLIVFGRGVGIVYAKVTYSDGDEDVYVLRDFKVKRNSFWIPVFDVGNWWVYDISYSKPPSSVNIQS